MLAGECPVRSILSPLGISIGEEVELANLPEILGVGCGCKGASNEGQAIRTEGLRVEVDFDLAISCNLQVGLSTGLSVIGDESDRCEDKTEEDCFIDHMQIFNNLIRSQFVIRHVTSSYYDSQPSNQSQSKTSISRMQLLLHGCIYQIRILFEQQRIMSQPNNCQLTNKVLSRIKEYKILLTEMGYSQPQILNSLAQLFHLHHPKTNTQGQSLPFITQAIASAITHNSKLEITKALANLQISIRLLLDEDSQPEEEKEAKAKVAQRKEKGKKKKEDKKKGKRNKQSALEEIREKTLADTRCEKLQIIQNLQKIELLKQFLQRKVLLDLCQQSFLPSSSAAQVLA